MTNVEPQFFINIAASWCFSLCRNVVRKVTYICSVASIRINKMTLLIIFIRSRIELWAYFLWGEQSILKRVFKVFNKAFLFSSSLCKPLHIEAQIEVFQALLYKFKDFQGLVLFVFYSSTFKNIQVLYGPRLQYSIAFKSRSLTIFCSSIRTPIIPLLLTY
mgnify:CR=1 FL=1